MTLPEIIPNDMLAPCGINCRFCSLHLRTIRRCPGCNHDGKFKPRHCTSCSRKLCSQTKNVSWCFECVAFPCQDIKRLDKTYRTRYGISLIEEGKKAAETGVTQYMEQEKTRWICRQCGGSLSLHDTCCVACSSAAR